MRRALGQEWVIAIGLVGLDVLTWIGIYALIGNIRVDVFYATPLQFLLIGVLQLTVIIASLFIIGGYSRHTDMLNLSYTTEHIMALLGGGLISAFLIYTAATFDQSMRPSRGVLLLSFATFLPLSLGYRRFLRSRLSASTANRAFLVVGSGDLAAQFYRAYKSSIMRQRLEFVGLDSDRVGQHVAGAGSPIIEGDLATKLERLGGGYSGVILAERIDRITPELLERLVRTQFDQTRVYTLESFHEAHWRYVPVQSLDPFWPLQMGFQLARNSPYHYFKRAFDIAVSTVLLIIFSPLIALIWLAIWAENGRPAIFRQTRVMRDNEPFTVYKFRTMFARTDEDAGEIYTRRDDPRITRIGKWLRKLRLDELPQLWNVFGGEMSLIGPRAEWIRCAERYEKIIPFYHFRHLVKPGITGWAQVNYPYGESDEDAIEKLKYDLYYIRHYSLKLDLMIVLKTVHTVLFGKGQ
jgi:exopolysaccharide biosynthesis polyprenyl glycosylphosphotransferase